MSSPCRRFLLVAKDQKQTLKLLKSDPIGIFPLALLRELQKNGVQVGHHFLNQKRAFSAGKSVSLKDLPRGPGDFLGLALMDWKDLEWVKPLLASSHHLKMVVYSPETVDPPDIQFEEILHYRTNEKDICRCLLRSALEYGHRHLVYVTPERAPWIEHRFKTLKSLVSKEFSQISLSYLGPESFWATCPWGAFGAWVHADKTDPSLEPKNLEVLFKEMRRRAKMAPEPVKLSLASFDCWSHLDRNSRIHLWTSKLLGRLSGHREATCLLFPCDSYAAHLETTMIHMGIPVPKALSLMSVDNFPFYITNLSATVDRGTEGLARSAVKHILGASSNNSKRDKNMVSRPFLAARPGLDTPRSGPLGLPDQLLAFAE